MSIWEFGHLTKEDIERIYGALAILKDYELGISEEALAELNAEYAQKTKEVE